jgi:hypothetical protein
MRGASKPLRANVNFEETDPTGEPNLIHLAPVREIIRSGELARLASMMVKGATRVRETTGAGGAEVRRTYRHGLPASLADEVEDESNTLPRLKKRPETRELV